MASLGGREVMKITVRPASPRTTNHVIRPSFTGLPARISSAGQAQQQPQSQQQQPPRPLSGCSASRRRCAAPAPRAASGSGAAAADGGGDNGAGAPKLSAFEQGAAAVCKKVTSLFPVWVIAAAVLGYVCPSMFTWFDNACITYSLMFVMLGMGLTLTFGEIASVFTKQPQLLLLGMVLQYTVLPSIGFAISRFWGLSSSLAIGVALVSCMPGGTASNIVAYIAKGDMPLSVMMTTASTLMAIFTTPLLTSLLVGTLVPVDPRAMFVSTLQLVLAPVLAGTALNQYFPQAVARLRVFTPAAATAAVTLIVGSLIAQNVGVVATSGLHIFTAVLVLHSSGFALGYFISKALGLSDRICRTNSIEVGMQSSALAAVLAKIHFPEHPMIVAPCVLSACTHTMLGSFLAAYWSRVAQD